ncbi:Ankyrin repeat protein [Beauveria bassiana ARSEF 2860]|uniref:Ankyrin repeat protein n=1 Tax=Beauveria bassiana (strain ARSEF 2860) TaxID=655819 RepID=J4VR59_BEAB2|nr:Ankyrin repeat protein [Beauveria bassiana ARSEF 2860]EJP61140.1 Ankyrin repeat protein [Beauveria bassiana ARSEF 2860]
MVPRQFTHDDYTVYVLCPTRMLSAADPQDTNSYLLGRIGHHNVVIACLPAETTGKASAATVAKDMLRSFKSVRFGLMVGIGGGAPYYGDGGNGGESESEDSETDDFDDIKDVRLGDVVIGLHSKATEAVVQYDFGKSVQEKEFIHAGGRLNKPPNLVLNAVSMLQGQHRRKGQKIPELLSTMLTENPGMAKGFSHPGPGKDKLFKSDVVHLKGRKSCKACRGPHDSNLVKSKDRFDKFPQLHYGTIGSADQVMKDAILRDKLAQQQNIMCFEMEAAGLMDSFPCLVIRGICDYADSHKNKIWQPYAAVVAAAYAKELLSVIPAQEVRNLSPIEQRTGTWFLQSKTFGDWKLGSCQCLWLHGMPGCGKTVLSATILDNLEKERDSTTLVFFFDFTDTRKQKLGDMLRSLVLQLYRLRPDSRKAFDSLFASHKDGQLQPDTGRLLSCLKNMMQVAAHVSVLLDALDECSERSKLLEWMQDFIPAFANVHLLSTSRAEDDIKNGLRSLIGDVNCIHLNNDSINADIRSYTNTRLHKGEEFKRWAKLPEVLDSIENIVSRKADGMFRWAVCQLDRLRECLDREAVDDTLQSLPSDLDTTYARILANIPPERKKKAIRLLQFLVYSERPLILAEAVDVIAVRIDAGYFNKNDRLQWPEDITAFCSSLVSLVESSDKGRLQTIQLAHFSVKEYLQQCDVSAFIIPQLMADVVQVCLTYLASIQEDKVSRLRIQYPLARYASEIWMDCAEHAEASASSLKAILEFLRKATKFRLWASLFNPERPWEDDPGEPKAAPLYFACLSGLQQTVYKILSIGADINAQGGDYGNALQAASIEGHQQIVQLLLDNGADIDAQGGRYGNALQAASYRGHQDIVQLLLDNGADINAQNINAQGGDYGNALQAASIEGYQQIVQLLLDNGADIDAQGGRYGNALQAASYKGHQQIVQLLLDKGADMTITSSHGHTPLHIAAINRQLRVLKLLLSRGANPNARDICGRTPLLHAASCTDELDSIQLLLKSGALIGMQDHYGSSPLLAAVKNGHAEVVRLLLTRGDIDIDTIDALGRSVSWWASKTGNTQIINLLVQRGSIVTELTAHEKQTILPTIKYKNAFMTCDACLQGISSKVSYYHCGICSGSDFDICLDCFKGGLHCPDKSHSLSWTKSRV